jgi:hypothetical protein
MGSHKLRIDSWKGVEAGLDALLSDPSAYLKGSGLHDV